MKKFLLRSAAALTLAAAAGAVVPAVAGADSTTTTTTTTTTSTTLAPTATAAASAWKTWHASWVAYVEGLRSINLQYRSSVQSARAAYDAALAASSDKAERQAARSTFLAALSADLDARVAAISAAGDPPSPPAGYNGTAYVEGIQAAHVAFRAAVTSAQSRTPRPSRVRPRPPSDARRA